MDNLKQKWGEYKERREAQKYFNENNDIKPTAKDLVLGFLVALAVSVIGSYLIEMLAEKTGFLFSLAYIGVAYAIALSIRQFVKKTGIQIALVALVAYAIGMVLGVSIYLEVLYGVGSVGFFSVPMDFHIAVVQIAFEYLVDFTNIGGIIFTLLGGWYIFKYLIY